MSQFLTMPEASAHCGGVPSPETLYRLAREGHLPVRRIGRRLVISERLLDQWIDSVGDVRDSDYAGTALAQRAAVKSVADPTAVQGLPE
jgi:excisionase family DNA binding protein